MDPRHRPGRRGSRCLLLVVGLAGAVGLGGCAGCEDGAPATAGAEGARGPCAEDPCLCEPVSCELCPGSADCVPPTCAHDEEISCRTAEQCGDPADFACLRNCCIELCHDPAECAARRECAAQLLGCVCDERLCRFRACSSSSECPPEAPLCTAGACGQAPPSITVTSCRLEPRNAVLLEGSATQLHVRAGGGHGPLPLLPAAFAFEASGTASVSESGLVTAGGEGTTTITASLGTTRCAASFVTLGALAPGDLRVVVTDELSGLPVEGATVQLEAPLSLSATTGPTGAAVFAGAGQPGRRTLSVFHDGYAAATIVGTGAADVALPVRRQLPGDLVGGFAGSAVPETYFDDNNVHVVVGGTSIPRLTELSLERLFGPQVPAVITLGGEHRVLLPEGMQLGLGSQWFKDELRGRGAPGGCSDPVASADGSCGAASAWAVGAGFALAELPIDLLTGGDGSLGLELGVLVPPWRNPRSAVVADVEYSFAPGERGNDGTLLPDPRSLTSQRLDLAADASQRCDVVVPGLPRHTAPALDAAIVLGGTFLPGRGYVPLGLRAGLDVLAASGEQADGWIDDTDGGSTGVVALRLAHAHGGLEDAGYAVVALALNRAATSQRGVCTANERRGCRSSSALVAHLASVPFGSSVEFSRYFLGLADDAAWDPASRRFEAGGGLAGATLHRITFRDGVGGEWNVLSSEESWTLPAVPAGMADRTLRPGGSRADVFVQALVVERTLDELVAFGGGGLGQLDVATTAFSTTELPR